MVLRSRDTLDTEALCGVRYEWLNSQKARDQAVEGWKQIVGYDVDVLDIPGNHFEVFDEQHVSILSFDGHSVKIAVLRKILDPRDSRTGQGRLSDYRKFKLRGT